MPFLLISQYQDVKLFVLPMTLINFFKLFIKTNAVFCRYQCSNFLTLSYDPASFNFLPLDVIKVIINLAFFPLGSFIL